MRPLTKALHNPSVRTIAGWMIGLLGLLLFFRYLTSCARTYRPTLGGLSWLIHLFIASGRLLVGLVRAYGWYLFATAGSLVVAWFCVRWARKQALLRG